MFSWIFDFIILRVTHKKLAFIHRIVNVTIFFHLHKKVISLNNKQYLQLQIVFWKRIYNSLDKARRFSSIKPSKRSLSEMGVILYAEFVLCEYLWDKRKVLNNTSQFVNSAYGLDTEKGESVEIYVKKREMRLHALRISWLRQDLALKRTRRHAV